MISDDLAVRVMAVNAATLLPLVERAIGATVRRVCDWQITPISGGNDAQVWRVQGHADLRDGKASWSLILKVPNSEPWLGDPWGGVREPIIYRSGFRSPLGGKFRLPQCYAVVEQPQGRPWLWLEDVSHDPTPTWTLARYSEVARLLGQFNGAFLVGYPLPAWPWLGGRSHLHELCQNFMPTPDAVAAGAYFWRQMGDSAAQLIDRYVDFYTCHQNLLALADSLPLTLCHGDTLQRNLLVRDVPDSGLQVVAIDWSQAGLSVLGADAGHLICVAAAFSHITPDQMPSLDHVVFPAYMQGLRDVGWEGDERIVRLGYAAATALWDGLILAGSMTLLYRLPEKRAWMSDVFGWPPALAADYLLAILQYHLDLADEAQRLAAALDMHVAS